jgi:hypothetical protein
MKHLFFMAIMSISTMTHAVAEWKVVADTTSCSDKIQVLGKEGEKYVLAVRGAEKIKLFAKDGAIFHENAMVSAQFVSDKSSDVTYTFTQPSQVEANPPKIDVAYNGAKKRCKMELAK